MHHGIQAGSGQVIHYTGFAMEFIALELQKFQWTMFQRAMEFPYAGIILDLLLKKSCGGQGVGLVKVLISLYPIIARHFAHGA